MPLRALILLLTLTLPLLAQTPTHTPTQTPTQTPAPQNILIDTDIGDDLDDVLALQSPELHILGITTAWGDTSLRARLLDRLLRETGHPEIPVAIGIERHHAGEGAFSQAAWARREPARPHPDAVAFLLDQIRQHPGDITLVALGPETNLAAALARDPATFRKLKRIVLMGGSVHAVYDDNAPLLHRPPDSEYNIAMDVPAAQAVFTSGVPLYVMPLDSTQLKLNENLRQLLFTHSSPLTDALTLLYHQFSAETKITTPTMFDAIAMAYAIDPLQCPTTPMHLDIDVKGYTRETTAAPNAQVCLTSNSDTFFRFYIPRLLTDPPTR